jgi:hypothetical protein
MCLVCNSTGVNVCAGGVCNISSWQQNINLLLITITPVIGGIILWMKNLIKNLKIKFQKIK